MKATQRDRHERLRKSGSLLAYARIRKERDPLEHKLRSARNANPDRSREMNPYHRLAKKCFPDDRRCVSCKATDVKTRLWHKFGAMVYWVAERLCGRCYGDRLSALMIARVDHAHLFCKTPESRSEWRALHERHQDDRAAEEAALTAAREKHGLDFANVLEKFLDWPEPERSAKVRAVFAEAS